jgi:hemerythrin
MSEPSRQNVLDVLDSDHRAVVALLGRAAAENDSDELAALCEELVMDVVRHFVAEEQYLLPLARERLGDGTQLSAAAFAEQADVESALRELEELDRSPTVVRPLLERVTEKIRAHVHAQDEGLFPALLERWPPEELTALGDEVLGAEQLAPTRPRGLRPASPAVNKLVSLVSGWVDHVRDFYAHRGGIPTPGRIGTDVVAGNRQDSPRKLCRPVIGRLFPDAPDADPSDMLLWCTGRAALRDQSRCTTWRWDCSVRD